LAVAYNSAISSVEGQKSFNRPCCMALSPANWFTWVCVLGPSLLYFIVAMPYYWVEVTPLLPFMALFFFFLTVGCLLAACCTDPGIIPRREVIVASGDEKRLERELGYNVLGVPAVPLDPDHRDAPVMVQIPIELRSQGYRWCSTCKIVRPPRASHCPDCDNCVLRFDHHCPFVNNCVGQRNYLFFFGFTSSVCCLALWVIPFLLWYLLTGLATQPGGEKKQTFNEENSGSILKGIVIALAVAGGLATLFVIALWAYHVFLIFAGLTTKEHWRGTPKGLPGFSEELTIFGRRGPRLFRPRAMVEVVEDNHSREGILARWKLKAAAGAVLTV